MRYFLIFLIFFTACLVSACSDDETDAKVEKPLPPTTAEDNLREFTGARTKIVWTQPQSRDNPDKQGTSRHQYLYALDSEDGRGAHKVLDQEGNYAYPIITPDGQRIVFTRKKKVTKGKKRKFDTTIQIVNFDGTNLRKLRDGYAQEVWEDPKTGQYWVYAGEEFIWAGGTAPICKRIIRFRLDNPKKSEVVWDRTRMGTDSFAISGDGKRFAGLFPWPKAGLGNLENGSWETLSNGCWTSMAPDNSYISWVFDGAHKNLLFFDSNGEKTATIPVNSHPNLKGKEVYHPRWGNHVRFFTLSGPHIRKSSKKVNGKKIEIFLGKFSPELDRVESWFKVTDNGLPDIYPDVWIEGGSAGQSGTSTNGPSRPVAAKGATWPSSPDGLLFKWQNVRAKNEFTAPDGSNQVTRTKPSGLAHYGPNFEMMLTGGTFDPILDADALLRQALGKETVSFQALVTAGSIDGTIFRAGALSLALEDGQLSYAFGDQRCEKFAEVPVGQPTHIALSFSQAGLTAFINGTAVPAQTTGEFPSSIPEGELTFGDELDGRLEHIAFYNRPLTEAEASIDAALIATELAERKPIERHQVKGKLVAVNPLPTVDAIKPYVRALVHYAYETDHPKLKEIAVAHWAILDSKPLSGFPREIGKTYDLTIELLNSHRQLNSQAVSGDETNPLLMLYYDVAPPKS